jgi:CBS domain containing-hemolysin-like protein
MIMRRNNGRFLVDALCPLDELVEACRLELPPDVTSDTTGGLIVELMGHIPQPGEKMRLGRHELTVIDAEATRVRRVEIQEVEPDLEETEPRGPGESSREIPGTESTTESIEPTSRSA